MLLTIKMPKLSPTMEFGTIVKWHKQETEFVNVGDQLLDIATDKAVISHTSTEEGWIRFIIGKEGSKICVGTVIAVVSSEKDEPASLEDFIKKEEQIQPSTEEPQEGSLSSDQLLKTNFISKIGFAPEPPLGRFSTRSPEKNISPLARSIAKSNNLDLSEIKGTGPGGRIVKKDIEHAPKKGLVGFGKDIDRSHLPGSYEEIPLSPIREVIASRLQASKACIPHFYVRQNINASALLSTKQQLESLGLKFSVNDLVTKACSLALKENLSLNSGFNSISNKIVMFKTIDISFAVSTPQGLITPIIRCADQKNLEEIREEIRRLVSKAKAGTLTEEEYKGGSFCISNLGMTGISEFTAIINPPQTAILALGAIETRPVVENNTVVVGKEMTITLSVDHRVIDGMEAALFLKQLQLFLENPLGLLLN